MKRLTIAIVVVFSILGIFVGNIPESEATTVLKLDKESLIANADQIVHGKVVERRARKGSDGRIYTHIKIKVSETLKGPNREYIRIKQLGGATDELVTRSFGLPNFEKDEEVVLFTNKVPKKQLFTVTGLKQGKFSVRSSPRTDGKFVVPNVENLSVVKQKTKSGQIKPRNLVQSSPSSFHQAIWSLESFKLEILNSSERQQGGATQ